MAQKTKTERKRFVDYDRIYVQNTPEVSVTVQLAQKQAETAAKAPALSTNSAKATKTMETRRTVHGQKTMTDSGVQSVKRAGKQRTQSQPETK